MYAWILGWLDGYADEWITDICMYGEMNRCMHGGYMDGCVDGCMDEEAMSGCVVGGYTDK